ncbi:MAG: hypothetical protein ACK4K3_02315 [Aquabacterium sp.]
MTFASIRRTSIIALTALAAASAQALTLPVNALVADSNQVFSEDAMSAFELFNIKVSALGNATAVAGTTNTFRLPITTITIGSGLQILSGDAKGSALEFVREVKGVKKALTLANFTINYEKGQVLADATAKGGVTARQAVVYNYTVEKPLTIKYRFPLSISLDESLNNLKLDSEMLKRFNAALEVNEFLSNAVIPQISFGALQQKIEVKFRSKPVSTKLYTPAP